MASFQSSTSLRQQVPTSTQNVLSTTSPILNATSTNNASSGRKDAIESHPQLGKWYMRNYGIGPKKDVKYLTRNAAVENRCTSIKFRAGMGSSSSSSSGSGGGGSNVVCELNFGSTTATSSALVVASGPRVELYRNNLTRALRAEGSTQKRRQMNFYDDDDDFDDEFDGGDDVLFGGRGGRKSKTVSADGYDSIDPDRNISTGGLLSACAAFRSDSKLIAIGSEGGVVRICDANSRATLRTFHSSNKEGGGGGGGGDRKTIRSVAWLRDGKRVVAAGDDGLVRIWNVGGATSGGNGNGAEMTLRGHGDKVTSIKVVSFRADDLRSKSKEKKKGATNDATTVASASSLITHTAPSDDAFDSPIWSSYVVSASYDHTLRVWDIESNGEARGQDRCISIMNHGDPIQALLVLPPANNRSYNYGGGGGGSGESNRKSSKLDNLPLVVSAGGTTLKIWNILNGSCIGTYPTKHAKTITALCLLDVPYDSSEEVEEDGNGTRRKRHIITAGLDGLLRVHSASNEDLISGSLPYLHGMQITEPISALAVSSDMNRIAIGTTTGIVMVYQRRRVLLATAAAASSTMAAKEPRHGTYSYFTRGANEKSNDPDDYMLMHQKKQKLAEYDLLLRKFRYGDALDAVLAKRQPQAVIAVIEELGKRCGLTIALSNRDEESLDAILSFTTRFIDNPQYTSHLIGVAHILCDIYGSLLGQSAVVDELFAKLRAKVAMECAVQKMLLRLVGQIDYVMNTAEILAAEEEMQMQQQKHS